MSHQLSQATLPQLELSLYENAIDSIRHGIEHYIDDRVETRRYKYAILQLSQGVALLLKERLRQEHPNFIFANVADEGKTVDIEVAMTRLEKIARVDLGHARDTIQELASLRNKIEHYAINISKQQAISIIGRTVPFLVSFCRDELDRNFIYEIGNDNWKALLSIREYLEMAIKETEQQFKRANKEAFFCNQCQANTAIETFTVPEDPTGLKLSFDIITCTVCTSNVLARTHCRECKTEITSANNFIPSQFSYCPDCRTKAQQAYSGYSNAMFIAEVKRWFQSHETVTATELLQLLRNVSTAGSSAYSYLREILNNGLIEFVYEQDMARFVSMREFSSTSRGLEPDDTFRLAIEKTLPI